ncbi:NAD-dependent epimerase/dehydratase family protein [Vibrio cholerae]
MEKLNTVLVLGGAGFIGSSLIKYLLSETDYKIISLGRGNLNEEHDRVKHIQSNININELNGIEEYVEGNLLSIINCSGSGSVLKSHQNPNVDFYQTACSTSDSLEFVRLNYPDAKFIQISSAAVYGECTEIPQRISTAIKPVSTYGFNNAISEMLVENYSNIYDISCIILRVFSVYGSGLKKQIVWDAFNKLSRGEGDFFGTGDEIRDFIHINDLSRIISSSISSDTMKTLKVINCGTGVPTKISQLIEMIRHVMESDCQVTFTGNMKTGDPKGFLAEVEYDQKLQFIPLEIGLRNYYAWFLEEINGKRK